MVRRPEPIELLISGFSVAFVAASMWIIGVDSLRAPIDASPASAVLLFLLAVVAVEPFLGSRYARYGVLIAHTGLVLILFNTLQGRYPLVELLAVVSLVTQLSMRLTRANGSIFSVALLAAAFLIGWSHEALLGDRFALLLAEAFIVFLAQSSIDFRERLVDTSQMLDSCQQSLENLHSASESFIEYLENVEEDSAERERFRITRELHDEIGYSMTNVSMMMNAAPYLMGRNAAKLLEYCQTTKQVASQTLRETRRILYKLRDVRKQSQPSLPIFFQRLCKDFGEATGIRTDCNTGNLPSRISENVYAILFRTIQVGFINALRHGNAAHIQLFFWVDEQELRMTIWNDTPHPTNTVQNAKEGIGLRGVRERMEGVNGRLSTGRTVDGFRLVVSIPRVELGIESNTSRDS